MGSWFRELNNIIRHGVSEEHSIFARRYARKAKQHIDRTIQGFGREAAETREMASSFYRMLAHKLNLNERKDPPDIEEVRAAVDQLKDVGRFSVFVTAVLLPGGVISLLGLELLARKYGIDFSLVPSSFRKTGKESPGQDYDKSRPVIQE